MKIDISQLNKHIRFYVLFLTLLALVFVRYVLQVALPWVVLLGLAALIGLLGDRDEIIAMCICCIPLYTSFQYIYGLAICMAFYLIRYHEEVRVDLGIFPILLMVVWELMHSMDEHSSMIGGIRALVPLIFCTFLMFFRCDRISYSFVMRTLAVCVSFMCVVVLSKLLVDAGFDIGKAFVGMKRLGFGNEEADVVGADFNPNFLGYICILASTGLIQLRMDGQKRKTDLLMVVFMLLCGMLTLSRTYLVSLALTAVLFMITMGSDVKKVLRFGGQMLAVALVVLLLLAICFPEMLIELYERFQVEDITSGRMDLIALYNERIFSSSSIWMFGIGCQSVTPKVEQIFGGEKILGTVVPHNAIQELLLCWGFPGLLLMIWFIWCLIASARRKNPHLKLINFIPLIVLLVKAQAGQLITAPFNLLCFAVAYLSLRHPFGSKTA